MNNRIYNKDELYKLALSNVHRYALLNEIFAIKDERFPKEQQETMLCVNGYIGIDTLDRYVRHINELVKYQDIGTIENFKQSQQEIDRLKGSLNTAIEDIFTLLRVINSNVKELKCSDEELEVINKYSYNPKGVEKND